MRNNKLEELLKEQFPDGGPDFTSADREVYSFLLSEFEKEPNAGLSLKFSHELNARLRKELASREKVRLYISSILIFICCSVCIITLMVIIDYNYKSSFLISVMKYKWIFLFIACGVFSTQYMDKKIVNSALKKIG